MIDIRVQKAEMQKIAQDLEDAGLKGLESGKDFDTIRTALLLKYKSLLGDFSDLPDEVEDNPTGQALATFLNQKLGFYRRMTEATERARTATAEMEKDLESGVIDKEKIPRRAMDIIYGFLADWSEQTPDQVRADLEIE